MIELDQNYGFAEGYNRALEQVDAEYVVLLNSDVEVTPHWLEPLLDYMDTHSGTVACQPKLLSWHNKEYFEYAGASGDLSTGMDILFAEDVFLMLLRRIADNMIR